MNATGSWNRDDGEMVLTEHDFTANPLLILVLHLGVIQAC
jgi:hypothetical protein